MVKGINITEDFKSNIPEFGPVGEIMYSTDTKEVGIRGSDGRMKFQPWDKKSKNYFKIDGENLVLQDSGKLVVVAGGVVSEYIYDSGTGTNNEIKWGITEQQALDLLEPNYHNPTDFPFVGKYTNDMDPSYNPIGRDDIATNKILGNYIPYDTIGLTQEEIVNPDYSKPEHIVTLDKLQNSIINIPRTDPCVHGMSEILWSPDGVNLAISDTTCPRFKMLVTGTYWRLEGGNWVANTPIIYWLGTGTMSVNFLYADPSDITKGVWEVVSYGNINWFSFNYDSTGVYDSLHNTPNSYISDIKMLISLDLTSLENSFRDLSGLKSISFSKEDVTKGVSNMNYAFKDCSSLVDIQTFNTTNVNSMIETWYRCSSLTSFPPIDTSFVTDFTSTWDSCTSLSSFPKLDMSSGLDFTWTWYDTNSLVIDFPQIDFSNGTTFLETWRLSGIKSFSNLDFSSATTLKKAFKLMPNLSTIDIISSSTKNVSVMWGTFSGCSSLKSMPFIDVSNCLDFYDCWYNCTSLTTFPALDMSSAIDLTYTWQNCSGIVVFSGVKIQAVTSLKYTWYGCTSLETLTPFISSSVTTFYKAWKNDAKLFNFPSLATDSATTFFQAWYGCTSLGSCPGLDGTLVIPAGADTTDMCFGI